MSDTPRCDKLAALLEGAPLEFPLHEPLREVVEGLRELERGSAWENTERLVAAASYAEGLLNALKFYARREHYVFDGEPGDWDTVSGEPQNWLFAPTIPPHDKEIDLTWIIEDGGVARAAIEASPSQLNVSLTHDSNPRGATWGPAIPEGWKLAPVEPTEAMFTMGYRAAAFPRDAEIVSAMYKAMLAAAPEPPVVSEGEGWKSCDSFGVLARGCESGCVLHARGDGRHEVCKLKMRPVEGTSR